MLSTHLLRVRSHVTDHKRDSPGFGAEFATIRQLGQHLKTHEGVGTKAHKCNNCGKGYNQPIMRNRHQQYCGEDKRLRCPLGCEGPGFGRTSGYDRHMKQHHPTYIYIYISRKEAAIHWRKSPGHKCNATTVGRDTIGRYYGIVTSSTAARTSASEIRRGARARVTVSAQQLATIAT